MSYPRHLIAKYSEKVSEGVAENMAAFKEHLRVERSGNTRVNVLYPPDLAGQLQVFAVLAQFRLQYPQAA